MSVAAERSFTKAAVLLGISQPAVSQNIAELEKIVGRKLFDRLRSEVVLTSEGSVFMDYARNIMDSCAAAGAIFADFPSSTIKISASEELYTYIVAPCLERFMAIHPEIRFERSLFDSADLVLALAPAPESAFETVPDAVMRLRIAISTPQKMGDPQITHESISRFDILWKPSPSFARTRLCRVLREFICTPTQNRTATVRTGI